MKTILVLAGLLSTGVFAVTFQSMDEPAPARKVDKVPTIVPNPPPRGESAPIPNQHSNISSGAIAGRPHAAFRREAPQQGSWTAKKKYELARRWMGDQPVVAECASKVADGQQREVSFKKTSLCRRKPPSVRVTNAAYQLRKRYGVFEVNIALRFGYDGDDENEARVRELVERAKPCMEKFYAYHGLVLNLTTVTNPKQKAHNRVTLADEGKRSNAYRWNILCSGNHVLNPNDVCSNALHELGHLVGLSDSYADPKCPDRPVGPLNSIMSQSWRDSSYYEFTNSDLKKILRPLCQS